MKVLGTAFSLALLLHGTGGVASAQDFGQARIEAGRDALAQQRYTEAMQNLRIACFTLVDQPSRLLESLALLAIAQSAAGRSAAQRRATLDRFLLVDQQFVAYGNADLSPQERQAFQSILLREIPDETLASIPTLYSMLTGRNPSDGSAATEGLVATRPPPPDETPILVATFPAVARATPTPTWTPIPASEAPVATATPRPPTAIPTLVPTQTPTQTPTRLPSRTPIPASATPVPTDTPVPPTAIPTLVPTQTPTRAPSRTPVPPSATSMPTDTPVPPTASPTLVPTQTPTRPPSRTPVPPSATSVPTVTPMPPTASPTLVPTQTPTRSPSRTPVPPSATSVPTETPTRTPSPTAVLPSATRAPTDTPTSTATRVPTWTPLPPRATLTARAAAAKPAPPDQLDRPLRPIVSPNPIYPPDDLAARIRGVVVLRVLVSEAGTPLDIVVLERARGHLTEAAVEAVRGWSFEAAVKNGRPVQSWTIVRIPFEAIPFPQPSPTRTPERSGG